MDSLDREILNLIQEEFPIAPKPFEILAGRIGLSHSEMRERIQRLRENGYIRRIGAILERKKLGYAGVLCGVHVNEKDIDAFALDINREDGVTHNYEREGELNVWFTIIGISMDSINGIIETLESKFGVAIYKFPEKKTFKIKTFFPV